MFCPTCGQQQASAEIRFCSRCGFLLTGVSQLIASGGALLPAQTANDPNAISPRKKGAKQGTLLLFLGFIIVPLLAMISIALEIEPYAVFAALILLGGGGILRIIYALLFESGHPILKDEGVLPEIIQKVLPNKKHSTELPPAQSAPASSYVPPTATNWRETNDLATPPSVTEPTTKLLQKDE
jgi:hypothetical protein